MLAYKEAKNEKAVEIIADLFDSASVIFTDAEIKHGIENKIPYIDLAKTLLKKYPKEIVDVLAVLHCEDRETFECSIPTIIRDIGEIMEDKDLMSIFF